MWNEEAAWPRDVRRSFINFEGESFASAKILPITSV